MDRRCRRQWVGFSRFGRGQRPRDRHGRPGQSEPGGADKRLGDLGFKEETRLQDSPAAIFVITVEDIWGQNLLGDRHSEFISYRASFLTEVPRGIVGKSPGGSDAQSNEKTIPILCSTAGRPTE